MTDMNQTTAAAEPTVAGVTYTLKPGSGISVSGRIPRRETHQMLVPLPLDVKSRLETLIEGGSVSGAMVGLIVYALDQIEATEQRMIVNMPAK